MNTNTKCEIKECEICSSMDELLFFRQYGKDSILSKIFLNYFRPELIDPHNNINFDDNTTLYVLNHSGMALPWDGFVFDFVVSRFPSTEKMNSKKKIVGLGDEYLMKNPFLDFFFIKQHLARMGVIEQSYNNFESLILHHKKIAYFPEGVKGIAKGFNKRYKLQKYSTSFIKLALKHKLKIIPVSVVNGEFINPYSYSFEPLNFISKLMIKCPFVPVNPNLILSIFPFCLNFCFPVKLFYVIHDPVTFDQNSYDLKEADYKNLAKEFRLHHQKLLNDSVKKYHKPYNFKEVFLNFMWSRDKWSYFPFLWTWVVLKSEGVPLYKRLLFHLPVVGYFFVYIFNRR